MPPGGGRASEPPLQADIAIAAIARFNNAAVATRDTSHFSGCGIEVINPWEEI